MPYIHTTCPCFVLLQRDINKLRMSGMLNQAKKQKNGCYCHCHYVKWLIKYQKRERDREREIGADGYIQILCCSFAFALFFFQTSSLNEIYFIVKLWLKFLVLCLFLSFFCFNCFSNTLSAELLASAFQLGLDDFFYYFFCCCCCCT